MDDKGTVTTVVANAWIGIDVSKDTLDVCLLRASGKEKHKEFSNDAAGHAKLLRWVEHLAGGDVCLFAWKAPAVIQRPWLTFSHKPISG